MRAAIAAEFDRLIAQNPSIAAHVIASRNGVLHVIDSVLANFGCLPAAKTARAAGPNLQLGTARGDRLQGGAGDDVQVGIGGNDRLTGGRGRDLMLGDAGNDRLDGGAGADIVDGGAGRDDLKGGAGTDLILGDAGNDTINARGGSRDYVVCGGGRDRVSADRRDVVARDCERVSRR
jgi:Ca2+-binding RTX toxin-like protein